jgi:ribosomal protein S18 acetylase RimI-like enzyme
MTHPPSSIEVAVAIDATDELVNACARLLPQLSSWAAPLDRAALAEIIASASTALLLARDSDKGGEIVGMLTLIVFRIPTAVRAWIEDVVVDSSARGRGVGESLTQAAIRLAAERGARTIDLTSRPSREAARRLYMKLGFKIRETDAFRYEIESRESDT